MNKNTNFQNLEENYLFKEIGDRANAYLTAHPDQQLLRMGVGDVTRPLPAAIVQAMQQAVSELGQAATFRGYCLEEGYEWLRRTIIDHDYAPLDIDLDVSEVFIGEGAGSDLGNLSELFARENRVAILDPSYPAYRLKNSDEASVQISVRAKNSLPISRQASSRIGTLTSRYRIPEKSTAVGRLNVLTSSVRITWHMPRMPLL